VSAASGVASYGRGARGGRRVAAARGRVVARRRVMATGRRAAGSSGGEQRQQSSGDGGGGDRPRPTRRRAACTFNRGNVQGSRGESWAHGSCTFGLKASPRPSRGALRSLSHFFRLRRARRSRKRKGCPLGGGRVGDSRFLDTPILQEASRPARVNRGWGRI